MPMYLKCAHPECSADFDYGQGRFFRFQQTPRHGDPPSHSHGVKHFWLCTRCCETFTIDYEKGVGVLLRQRFETLTSGQPSHFVLQDEGIADRGSARGLGRSRARKRNVELTTGETRTVEILENRNLGRRSLDA